MTVSLPEFFGADDYGPLLDVEKDAGPRIGTSDFVCPFCDTPLTWGGRGRKPKHCTPNNGGNPECTGPGMKGRVSASGSSGTKRGTKNVETALAVMESAYDNMIQALLFVSPEASSELENRVPAQQKRNRACFEANPALAARVAGWGGKGGMLFFLLSNAAMLSAVVRVALPDVKEQAAVLSLLRNAGGSTGRTAPLSDLFGAFGVPA